MKKSTENNKALFGRGGEIIRKFSLFGEILTNSRERRVMTVKKSTENNKALFGRGGGNYSQIFTFRGDLN